MRACVFAVLLATTDPGAAPEPAPLSADERAAHVRSLLERGEWAGALVAAREAGSATPQTAAALGEALFRAGRLVECDALLTPLGAAPGDALPARGLVVLARLRAAQGRSGETRDLMERALAADADDPEVLYWAGDLHPDRRRSRELLERFLAAPGGPPERIEAVRQTLAWFDALGDRRVWVAARSPERVELPLARVWEPGGATVGFVVTAQIGEPPKPVRLLLDSGSHGLLLIERMARKRGFAALAERSLFGGEVVRRDSHRGLVPSLALGELRYADPVVTTTPGELDPTGRFHGLLGLAIFGGYRVTLDLVAGRMVLDRGSPADAAGVPYWWIAGQMLVPAGVRDREPGLFVLDTGAATTALGAAYLAASGASPTAERPVEVRGVGGSVPGARLVRGIELVFLDRTSGAAGLVARDMTATSRLAGVEIAGLVGLDVLAGAVLEIDTVAQRVRRR